MVAYATDEELATYTGAAAPADADRLLLRASELIDEVTLGRAAAAWADPLPDPVTEEQAALRDAACAQVEFWISFGEAHDVEGVRDSIAISSLRIDRLPDELARRARRYLRTSGLLTALVGSYPHGNVLTVAELDAI